MDCDPRTEAEKAANPPANAEGVVERRTPEEADQIIKAANRRLPEFMPRYRLAEVRAIRIGQVESLDGAKVRLMFEDDGHTRAPFEADVNEDFEGRYPGVGDYLVLSQDGTLEVVPGKAFEQHFTKG